jgi:group I intron endonuclease
VKKKTSGIYAIVDGFGRSYVGSAVCLVSRKSKHFGNLRNGRHVNKKLQASWNKYGEAFFRFEVLFVCEKNVLLEREQEHIDRLQPHYNLRLIAESNLGVKWPEEVRARMSEGQRRHYANDTPEDRAKYRSFAGRTHTEETKQKMCEANARPDVKEKVRRGSANAFQARAAKGFKISDEAKIRMSAGQFRRWASDQKGKDALSARSKGRIVSEETRARLSANKLAYWASKRAEAALSV